MCVSKEHNQHDECLGWLDGTMNACCGHGNDDTAYVQFLDGSVVRGKHARTVQHILKHCVEDSLYIFDLVKEAKIKDFEIGRRKAERVTVLLLRALQRLHVEGENEDLTYHATTLEEMGLIYILPGDKSECWELTIKGHLAITQGRLP